MILRMGFEIFLQVIGTIDMLFVLWNAGEWRAVDVVFLYVAILGKKIEITK